MPLDEKRKYADFVIDTSGEKEDTCGRPGPSTKHYGESNHESVCDPFSGPPCWWPVSVYVTRRAHWDVGAGAAPRAHGRPPVERTRYRRSRPAFPPTSRTISISTNRPAMPRSTSPPRVYTRRIGFSRSIRKKAPAPASSSIADGEILTNNHVVGGGSQLTVKLSDKKVYKAKVLGNDPRNDLALIKIEPAANCPPCAWAIPTTAWSARRCWPSATRSASKAR